MLSTKCFYKSYLIYMYKENLALDNQPWLICHKTQPNLISSPTQFLNDDNRQTKHVSFLFKRS